MAAAGIRAGELHKSGRSHLDPTPAGPRHGHAHQPGPAGTAATFLKPAGRDYAGMYSLLSPLSQDAVKPADFRRGTKRWLAAPR